MLGTGSWVPDRVVGNDEVVAHTGGPSHWITRKTAIVERRWADEGTSTADAAEHAARAALAAADVAPEQLGLIVLATSTPDQPQPPTACTVQDRLGAVGAAALDLNAVCSGFLFALATARGLLATGEAGRHALIIGADLYSRILDRTDHRTVVLFGDGAGAVVLGPARQEGRGEILATRLRSFGSRRSLIEVPPGGLFRMDGRAVSDFVLREVPPAVGAFLADNEVALADIRHLFVHQANGVLVDKIAAELGLLPGTVVHKTVDRYGNTASAAVPLTLDRAYRTGTCAPGESALLLAFGGGMAVGMALIRT
ncbi:beta-ketoacyl-ACP synthase 3 [Streptomyces calidiresistens]|uniref:Beta-ketoacyl-ACP synthase 3 n=1 Tax=Streptomyces calidiresistens TaxID=1485586 RepID=A0A7W3XWU1_9ACTN|nr:beta-ketoacyl-ACP synthase 3 [Streptomyces calidiresistens]